MVLPNPIQKKADKASFSETMQVMNRKFRTIMESNTFTQQAREYMVDAGLSLQRSVPNMRALKFGPQELLSLNTVLFGILGLLSTILPGVVVLFQTFSFSGPEELSAAVRCRGILLVTMAFVSNTARIFYNSKKVQTAVTRDILRCFFAFYVMSTLSMLLFGGNAYAGILKWGELGLCALLAYFHAAASDMITSKPTTASTEKEVVNKPSPSSGGSNKSD
eukprot:278070_1